MDLDKRNMKKIRSLIIFTALVILVVIYFKEIIGFASLGINILLPLLIGGAIAFVLNIPMRGIEKRFFDKFKNKYVSKIKRPVSILLSIILVLAIIVLVFSMVIPQIGKTAVDLTNKLPAFMERLMDDSEQLFASNPQITGWIDELEKTDIDWNNILTGLGGLIRNRVGTVLSSTLMFAGNIVGGIINTFIALIFAIYILAQKEKLSLQIKSLLQAFIPKKQNQTILKIAGLLHQNFSNFISGQCLEALILGGMFFVVMIIFRFPYALLISVLIAFTALIPVVGGFIGCGVGVFLILIDDPLKALIFLIMFLVIQQIETNLIYPHVVGSSVGLPSMWVLAAVIAGGSLFGVIGMLVFIPLVSTLYALLRETVRQRNSLPPRGRSKKNK